MEYNESKNDIHVIESNVLNIKWKEILKIFLTNHDHEYVVESF